MRLVTCSFGDCEKPLFNLKRQLCAMHYARLLRNGSPESVRKVYSRGTTEERFHRYFKVEGDCWIWIGGLGNDGYAGIKDGDKRVGAHRWAYEFYIGPIPEGMYLDHFKCGRTDCVNPNHVRPVTPRENVLRSDTSPTALNLAKQFCKRGHPLDEENTYTRPNGNRQCRACNNARMRASNAQKRVMSLSD